MDRIWAGKIPLWYRQLKLLADTTVPGRAFAFITQRCRIYTKIIKQRLKPFHMGRQVAIFFNPDTPHGCLLRQA